MELQDHILNTITTIGSEIIRKPYRTDIFDPLVLLKLWAYFRNEESLCKNLQIDSNKGIYMCGPVGCGKTILFSVCHKIAVPNKKFISKHALDFTSEFKEIGESITTLYSNKHFKQNNSPKTLYIEDLGKENKIFNTIDVVEQILLKRYVYFNNCGMLTHVCSNLYPEDILKRYSEAIYSRFAHSMNIIEFKPNSKDLRFKNY